MSPQRAAHSDGHLHRPSRTVCKAKVRDLGVNRRHVVERRADRPRAGSRGRCGPPRSPLWWARRAWCCRRRAGCRTTARPRCPRSPTWCGCARPLAVHVTAEDGRAGRVVPPQDTTQLAALGVVGPSRVCRATGAQMRGACRHGARGRGAHPAPFLEVRLPGERPVTRGDDGGLGQHRDPEDTPAAGLHAGQRPRSVADGGETQVVAGPVRHRPGVATACLVEGDRLRLVRRGPEPRPRRGRPGRRCGESSRRCRTGTGSSGEPCRTCRADVPAHRSGARPPPRTQPRLRRGGTRTCARRLQLVGRRGWFVTLPRPDGQQAITSAAGWASS